MVPLCPPPKNGLVETRVHAALEMPSTLAALSAIFQAFPASCPCEPRLTRGEMQAVPCGSRSNTRLLPAFTSQCKVIGRGHRVPPAGLPIEQVLGEYSLSLPS